MYYIGIGASAGGQAALCELLDHLAADLGAVFFVSTHLSIFHRSVLNEILQRHTKMHVFRVDRPMRILPNAIYVQPEKAYLLFDREFVGARERHSTEKINRSVDVTFESLAQTFGPHAIAVILSGTGTDGTKGALAVREKGGHILVQDPASTQYKDMPSSAIDQTSPVTVGRPAHLAWEIKMIMVNQTKRGT